MECWLGHPLFLGPRDYHWRGLTSSVRQVSRKSPSGAKKVDTYPPKLPIFSPKARQVSKKIAYNGVFVDTCFWNGIWPGQAGARREPSKLSAAPPLSAEPRIARRWCPPTARPTAPRRALPHLQPPPSLASARRRAAPPAALGRKAYPLLVRENETGLICIFKNPLYLCNGRMRGERERGSPPVALCQDSFTNHRATQVVFYALICVPSNCLIIS